MFVMIYDVAASESGALTILKKCYDSAFQSKDEDIHWVFVISTPNFPDMENITVLRYPWIKKSWLHRIVFDEFFAPRIVKKYKIDRIISLQNMTVPRTKVPQTVYLHQVLPFSKYRFKLTQNKTLWIYQNIIGRIIKKSLPKADKVITQTVCMKKCCIEDAGVLPQNVEVQRPEPDLKDICCYKPSKSGLRTFVYPATPYVYKNHELILKACEILNNSGYHDYQVIFTFTGDENENAAKLFSFAQRKKLNVKFAGTLPRSSVLGFYSKFVLVFPSYIESCPMPLLEAKAAGTIILASDTPFARELLYGDDNAHFYGVKDENALASLMKDCIDDKIVYNNPNNTVSNNPRGEDES
jgi:glycosyltransferase involved in cell wall biosynthesis